ncbi:unnamed protein product [Caretta caretta]
MPQGAPMIPSTGGRLIDWAQGTSVMPSMEGRFTDFMKGKHEKVQKMDGMKVLPLVHVTQDTCFKAGQYVQLPTKDSSEWGKKPDTWLTPRPDHLKPIVVTAHLQKHPGSKVSIHYHSPGEVFGSLPASHRIWTVTGYLASGEVGTHIQDPQFRDAWSYNSWVKGQTTQALKHTNTGLFYALTAIDVAIEDFYKIIEKTSDAIVNLAKSQARGRACEMLARDLFNIAKENILDVCLGFPPSHTLSSPTLAHIAGISTQLIVASLLPPDSPFTFNFLLVYPSVIPTHEFPSSFRFKSIEYVANNMVYKVGLSGYLTLSPDNATLMRTSDCCTETNSYIMCSCSTLCPLTSSSSVVVVDVLPLADGEDAVQVSTTQ